MINFRTPSLESDNMPKYDFSCIPCDSTVEMHFTFDSVERPICEKCGGFMIKVYTPPAVQFKGGGWGGQA
jgi:putative FmdB family regulatory protein